jgi:glucose-6-phosphate 1-dehydrogenase
MSTHPFHPASEIPDNHIIVLFGSTGDLAKRKIIPGLFHLASAGLLPKKYRIIASAPRGHEKSTDEFRTYAREAVEQFGSNKPAGKLWDQFHASLSFAIAETDNPEGLPAAVKAAEEEIGGTVRRLYHLAVPPNAVLPLIEMLGSCGLNKNARVICEKPFGVDLASARKLNSVITANFEETQVYRIDHFLGKESIDNILALRFANRMFEPLWNRDHVCFVQIDVPETLSIEDRGAFYEETGAFRDMVVSHLFQVLGFIAMEQPTSLEAGPLRDEVHKIFQTLRPIDPKHVVRGQYEGYRKEKGVASNSQTETFVALRCEVENTRWKGVPFYLRTGKCLAQSRQVITIGFDEPVMRLFPKSHHAPRWRGNKLVVDFVDPGSIHAHFMAKEPGPQMLIEPAQMTFHYKDSYQEANNLEAYEHLILEAMLGNRALFTRSDGIERLWEVAAPLLDDPPPVQTYAKGSWGPDSIQEIISPNEWCLPE